LPYALDAHRIVVGGWGDMAIWDLRGGSLRRFPGTGSASYNSMSGIGFDERAALSSGERMDGVTFHDLRSGTRATYYHGYEAYSPRFSPDGTRWAFFGKSGFDHLALIIRWTREPREMVIPLSRDMVHGGHVLAWSPTGARIASVLSSSQLVIWDSEGNQLHRIKLPFKASWYWPPVWNKDETGVYILLWPDVEAIPYRYKPPLKPQFGPLPNSSGKQRRNM
jgi:WD40 repeat protein